MAKNAVSVPTANEEMLASVGFKVKKVLTVPRILLTDDMSYILRFDEAMYEGVTGAKDGESGAVKQKDGRFQKSIPLAKVSIFGAKGGEPIRREIIVPLLLQKKLEELFPDDGYVGETFCVAVHPKSGASRYKTIDLAHLDPVE